MGEIYPAQTILLAFGLTLVAGLSTGIGSALAFFARRTSVRFLSVALGFSAGVMIYIALVEILPNAQESLRQDLGKPGTWAAMGSFFGGILLIALVDK
ncbi:MAG: zinc transporter ZupT, partial [Candidatus Aminicenantes bacterium]|nr:zinc transporter ZupT [Candidatus Aminicenantes bacterium]